MSPSQRQQALDVSKAIFNDQNPVTQRRLAPGHEMPTKAYEFPQWEIKPRDVSLSRQTQMMDSIKNSVGMTLREHRPERVKKVVIDINSELRKIRELLESSCFLYSLKHSMSNQIDTDVQHVNESYNQVIQSYGYIGFKGGASREQNEANLKMLLSDLQAKRKKLDIINELEVISLDDMKHQVDGRYEHFKAIFSKCSLYIDNDEMKRKLSTHETGMQNFHGEFTSSCRENDFLEAGKWAKMLMSEKEAFESYLINHSFQTVLEQYLKSEDFKFESYLINQSFQTQFLSRIKDQAISQPEQVQLAEINRRTPVSAVPEKWQKAFIIARGYAVSEKVSNLPKKDIYTYKTFNDQYKNRIEEITEKDKNSNLPKKDIIEEIEEKDSKGKFKVTTWWFKEKTQSAHINYIDIDNGVITADNNFRNHDTRDGCKTLPNSEIFYHQLLLVLKQQHIDPSNFHLTQVIRKGIDNKETRHTLDCCITPLKSAQSTNNTTYRFAKGSDEYYAILGTPNAYSTLFLLKQHPSTFGNREITSIEVEMPQSGSQPDIILHIGQRNLQSVTE
jgi:hypothetical protein